MFLWSSPSPSCLIPTSACYVGGQEDMIIDVALQLRRERESALLHRPNASPDCSERPLHATSVSKARQPTALHDPEGT
jgi:DmpG-like communication domain